MSVFPICTASLVIPALVSCQGCASNAGDYVQRGRQFIQKGDSEAADLQFLKALQKDPQFGEAHLRHGQFLSGRSDSRAAYAEFSRAAELMPESDEPQAELGRLAIRMFRGDPQHPAILYKAADKAAATLLSKNPNSFEGLQIRGYIAMADSKPKEAIENFQKANRVRPSQPYLITVLIENLLIDNQKAEAERLGRQSLAQMKNYGPLYDALYFLYMDSKRTGEAEQLLRTKIANNPAESFFVVQLADHFRGQRKTVEMDEAIKGLVSLPSKYLDGAVQAGDFYQRIGQADRALAMYENGAVAGASQRQKCLEGKVRVYLKQGRREEAAKVLEDILKTWPEDGDSLASRADLRMASGQPEEMRKAIAEFSRAAEKKPGDSQIKLGLAGAYRQTGQLDAARATLQKILQSDSQNRDALGEMADLDIRTHRPDDALRYAERLIEIDPNDLRARLIRTSAWAQLGLFNKVETELRLLTAAAPALPEAWIQWATLNLIHKNYAESERVFRRFYKPGSPDMRPLRGLVSVYQAQGQPKRGLDLVRREAQNSGNAELRTLLATSAAQAGDVDLALSTTLKLAADFPQNPDHLMFAGELYVRQGQVEQAIASCRKAQQAAPLDPLPGAHLSVILGNAGRYAEAVAAGNQSLKLRPGDPVVMNNVAWYLAQAGDLDQAGQLARQAVQKAPSNPRYRDTLGVVYMKSKKFADAENILADVVGREPNNPEYRTHFAMVLIELGQRGKARTELQTALLSRPPAGGEQEIRALLKPLL